MIRLDTFQQKWEAFSVLLTLLIVACLCGVGVVQHTAPSVVIPAKMIAPEPDCTNSWVRSTDEICALKHT